ncbi:hypothetical protein [Bradyrhizobium betae]|uniref:Uncharacterized protein n=1 Tax=Bradyrhizobium betae TaxID=244734 RepID=A0A5P6NZA0_9BRAD|nr:hypothetical protein [Bradyrhizobium betae]MCS3725307.1 hypothetical protein [Bradyrhizobium betae]QFI71370.1 hypothetical protein F8237_02705 [Bradyrhizobium betae]
MAFEHVRTLLFEGWIDPEETAKALDGGRYYSDPASEPVWLRAWRGWDLTDDEYKAVVDELENIFNKREFGSSEEMLHIFELRLQFAEIGAIAATKRDVVTECEQCLDALAKDDKIPEFDLSKIWRVGGLYCLGHQVTLSDTPEFREIFDAFESRVAAAKVAELPTHGKALLLEISRIRPRR